MTKEHGTFDQNYVQNTSEVTLAGWKVLKRSANNLTTTSEICS